MNGKPSVVNVICFIAQKVEELGIHDCHDEIEGVIGIGNDDEQRRLPVSDCVQLHLIVAHQLPQLCDVEGRKPCTAGNQNRLSGFARRQLVFAVLLDRKVVRVAGFQLIEHDIHGVLECLIVLSGFRGIDHFEQGSKVFLVIGCLIPDVADESCVVELFRLDPEIFAGLIAVSLRVDDDRIDQLEDVLLAADVAERVVVHGFPEIDGVQRLDDVAALFKHFAALHQHRTLRVSHNVATVHLHQVRFDEKARLA